MSYPTKTFFRDTAYPVMRIIDGDTVEIRYDGKFTSVVLIGVDTPGTVHPQKPVEAFGEETTAFTRNLLLGESVYLRFDRDRTDKYGRLLAYLYRAPDRLFGKAMGKSIYLHSCWLASLIAGIRLGQNFTFTVNMEGSQQRPDSDFEMLVKTYINELC